MVSGEAMIFVKTRNCDKGGGGGSSGIIGGGFRRSQDVAKATNNTARIVNTGIKRTNLLILFPLAIILVIIFKLDEWASKTLVNLRFWAALVH